MPKPSLDLRQLQIFLCVAEHKNLRRAASLLGITPSAVSQAVSALENALATQLIRRDSRPLTLTESGRRLLQEGAILLDEADHLLRRVCSEGIQHRSLRLGLGESTASTIAPWLIKRLYERVAELTVFSELTKPLVQRLENGTVDVIVCAGPQLDDAKWQRQEAYREDFLLVTARSITTPKTLEDLRELAQSHPLIGYNDESADQVLVNRFLIAKRIVPQKRLSVSSSYGLVGLISQCSGFGVLPATDIWCGRQFLFDVNVAALPSHEPFYRSMWVVGKGQEESAQLDLVLSQTREVLHDYMFDELKRVNLHLEEHIRIPQPLRDAVTTPTHA